MIRGLDHVALPMRNADAMVAFYSALGCSVDERRGVAVVHAGDQMINFHRPELWSDGRFTLRAPAAVPPCGDLCFVWDGGLDALDAAGAALGVTVEEGPVERQGGRGTKATSVYLRDPDGNLVELMVYGAEHDDAG